MRNLFDQFKQPENRLTHALMSSLHEDSRLLKRFIQWPIGESAPPGQLQVVEQSVPGEEGDEEIVENQRRGLPDGWIFNEKASWALLIESKIECPLTADQIQRHRSTAQRRGFTNLHVLSLVTELPNGIKLESKLRRWTELYTWLRAEAQDSYWAKKLHEYMEVLEAKLVKEEYLKSGPLTVFTGVHFNNENPYSYLEAKRALRLAMEQLRKRDDLYQVYAIDRGTPGRTAITGREASGVWDFLRLKESATAKFTDFPHLTLGLHREFMHAIVIVPNGLRSDFRKNLLAHGFEPFRQLFSEVLKNVNKSLGTVKGAVPWVEAVQRRYPSQRAEPFIDAKLEFDLRTAFPSSDSIEGTPKLQHQWLQLTYEALRERNSNLQLATGVRFYYDRCTEAGTPKILDHIAHSWIACSPLVNKLLAS